MGFFDKFKLVSVLSKDIKKGIVYLGIDMNEKTIISKKNIGQLFHFYDNPIMYNEYKVGPKSAREFSQILYSLQSNFDPSTIKEFTYIMYAYHSRQILGRNINDEEILEATRIIDELYNF